VFLAMHLLFETVCSCAIVYLILIIIFAFVNNIKEVE